MSIPFLDEVKRLHFSCSDFLLSSPHYKNDWKHPVIPVSHTECWLPWNFRINERTTFKLHLRIWAKYTQATFQQNLACMTSSLILRQWLFSAEISWAWSVSTAFLHSVSVFQHQTMHTTFQGFGSLNIKMSPYSSKSIPKKVQDYLEKKAFTKSIWLFLGRNHCSST